MRRDTAERRPLGRKAGALNDARDGGIKVILSTRRCFSWRARHGCGCETPADCTLNRPMPVHGDQPCRGEFTPAGWRPCCGRGAA
jgi:hypothetical protein